MADRTKLLALFGCGLWGRNILRDLVALNCRVVVVDPVAECRRIATEMGATLVLDDGAQLPDVEGIVIATPASTHVSLLEENLHRGVPVFCEKPLTTDPAPLERLSTKANDQLFEMHIWRYHPGVEKLAELARDNTLGRVEWLKSTRTNWTSPRKDVDPVWTLMPHDLSITLEILGHLPPPLSAIAEKVDGQPVGMIGTLQDTTHVVLEVSTRYEEKRREIRMHCTNGVAVLSHDRATHINVYSNDPLASDTVSPDTIPISIEPPLLRELRTFINYLDGGPPPRSSMADSTAVISTLSQLRQLAGMVVDS